MNKKDKQFVLMIMIALALIYIAISFVELTFNVVSWNVVSRIVAVISFFAYSIITARNI